MGVRMNLRLVSAVLFAMSALVFFLAGFRAAPRNTTFVVLGVVFAMFAVIRFRSARRP